MTGRVCKALRGRLLSVQGLVAAVGGQALQGPSQSADAGSRSLDRELSALSALGAGSAAAEADAGADTDGSSVLPLLHVAGEPHAEELLLHIQQQACKPAFTAKL